MSYNDSVFNLSGLNSSVGKGSKFNESINDESINEDDHLAAKRKGLDIPNESVHFQYEKDYKKVKSKTGQTNPRFVCKRPEAHLTDSDAQIMHQNPRQFIRNFLPHFEHLKIFQKNSDLFKKALEHSVHTFNDVYFKKGDSHTQRQGRINSLPGGLSSFKPKHSDINEEGFQPMK